MDCWPFLQVVATVVLAILGILIPIAGMFMWNRAEANADRAEANADRAEANADRREAAADRKDMASKTEANIKAIHDKIDANAKDTRALIDANIALINTNINTNMKETREMINAIKEEVKDFHARLCVIESNRKIIISKDGHLL